MRSYLDDQRRIKAHIALSDHPLVLAAVKPRGVVVDILDVDDEVGGGLLASAISGSVGQAKPEMKLFMQHVIRFPPECLSLLKVQTRLSPRDNLIVSATRRNNHLNSLICQMFVTYRESRF